MHIYCLDGRCGVILRTGIFAMDDLEFQFNSWFHLVLVYHGPNNGQGITVHLNSNSISASVKGSSNPEQDSSGEVVIGKLRVDEARDYSTVMADELTFWNRQLSDAEVAALAGKHEM